MSAPLNLLEKILARASGRAAVAPGDVVIADVDAAIFHDLSCNTTARLFKEAVGGPVHNPEHVVTVFDHLYSPPTEDKAAVLAYNREFAKEQGLTLYDCGHGNIHHVAFRGGHVRPGDLVIGSDSHSPVHGAIGAAAVWLGNYSCAGTVLPHANAWLRVPELIAVELVGTPPPGTTARDVALWLTAHIGEGNAKYAALRFEGEYVQGLSFWDRWLLTLMSVDVGAKCGFIEPDAETERTLAQLSITDERLERSDHGAKPTKRWRWDVSDVPPVVACPPSFSAVRPVDEVEGTVVRWAELGGHGGGRTEDIEQAASLLDGYVGSPDVCFNVVPSSRQVLAECLDRGLVAPLHAAGAMWFPASGGSNQATNMGAMAPGEAMVSTQSRNFPGRNGSRRSQMYLASALTVAASVRTGRITDPRRLL